MISHPWINAGHVATLGDIGDGAESILPLSAPPQVNLAGLEIPMHL